MSAPVETIVQDIPICPTVREEDTLDQVNPPRYLNVVVGGTTVWHRCRVRSSMFPTQPWSPDRVDWLNTFGTGVGDHGCIQD